MNAGVDGFNPTDSDSDIPLMSADHHWEHTADAVADPILYTTKPRVIPNSPFNFRMSKLPRDEEEGVHQPFTGHGHDRQENGETGTASFDLHSDAPFDSRFGFSRSRGIASPTR
jgi:hypothetical protein